MKRVRLFKLIILVVVFCAALANAQAKPQSGGSARAGSGADLEKILTQMDDTAASFKSTEASFEWDQYQKVVDEHDLQKGTIYFRRAPSGLEMAAEIAQPDQKHVLFTDGRVQVYQPKVEQVTVYNAGKNRAEFESFLVLGFGGRGHDLPRQFDVRYAGTENVGGVNAAKLELVPKQQKVKNMFSRIVLWIDPSRGVSVQQQFVDEKSGDYRLAKYTNIKMNQKVPDSAFKLKTTSKTKFVTPQA